MSHNIQTQFDAYVRAAMLLARYEYDHTDDPAAHIDWFEEMLKQHDQEGLLDAARPEEILAEVKKQLAERNK